MSATMRSQEDPVVANRRARLRAWIDVHFGGSQTLFIGSTFDGENQLNQGELSALLKNKSFGERRARSLEKMARMPERYLDDMGAQHPPSAQPQATEPPPASTAWLAIGTPAVPPGPTGWPFKRVALARIVSLKQQLGAKAGAAALDDIDETLDLIVSKWERRAASRAKSAA